MKDTNCRYQKLQLASAMGSPLLVRDSTVLANAMFGQAERPTMIIDKLLYVSHDFGISSMSFGSHFLHQFG